MTATRVKIRVRARVRVTMEDSCPMNQSHDDKGTSYFRCIISPLRCMSSIVRVGVRVRVIMRSHAGLIIRH